MTDQTPERRTPRIFLHSDGEYISIGFNDTNDTLLRVAGGWHDRDVAREWVLAIERLIEAS